VEIRQGKWICDCGARNEMCAHQHSAYLHRSTSKLQPEPFDESNLKCRHCGSPDVARCEFRYDARGIARRYRCNDCERKFSIPHVQSGLDSKPDELVWLLNEVGMLTSKLTELITELNTKLELDHLPQGATRPATDNYQELHKHPQRRDELNANGHSRGGESNG